MEQQIVDKADRKHIFSLSYYRKFENAASDIAGKKIAYSAPFHQKNAEHWNCYILQHCRYGNRRCRFLILPICLKICEMLFLDKKSRKAENTIEDSAEDSFSALDIPYSESCTVGMSVAETIRKNKEDTFNDLLKQYNKKTDSKDAKKIRKLLSVMEENHIAVPSTLERQQLPLIKESLKSYLFTPDEVSECVVHEMEKNIDQMLCKVLQQLQDTFDAYYEDKSQDIEINRTVVEQLSPKDPFGGNI